jgi:hypothetical protein
MYPYLEHVFSILGSTFHALELDCLSVTTLSV